MGIVEQHASAEQAWAAHGAPNPPLHARSKKPAFYPQPARDIGACTKESVPRTLRGPGL